MPDWNCFPWPPTLLWLHTIADSLNVLAYYAMLAAVTVFVRRRSDISYRWIALLLGGFLFFGGTVHLLEAWNLWMPNGWAVGIAKAIDAALSLGLAAILWPILPKLLVLPSPEQLLSVNQELDLALEKHKRAADELRKLSLAVEHSPSMVLITDRDGRVEYCNPAFSRITGYAPEEMLGRRASLWNSASTEPSVYRELWEALGRGDTWEGELLKTKKSGSPYWCLEYVASIRDERAAIVHYVVISQDINDLKNSEETIRRLAFFDPLTNLPNRTLFRERLEQLHRRAQHDHSAFAVIYLDLDRFKNINDSLGHVFGDQLLAAVGKRLRQCLREEDTVARLGGDEFAIILPGIRHPRMAGAAATAITQTMNQPFELSGHTLFVTASLGISLYPGDHTEIEQLIKMADTAMYNAKDKGRNQYQYYKEATHAKTEKVLALETGLRYALERGELEIHYQPKVDPASGRCHSAEALLRWRHPEQGLVSPGRFIPVAEETGLIVPIGEWVLRTVCRQIVEWQAQGLDMAVAVNLSAQQFQQKSLLDHLDLILDETKVDHARLELEITESAVMGDPEQTAAILRAMKARGMSLSIDDFGTGYSSLSYLQMFPIDILKIDQSFVRTIGTPAGDTRIVRAIVALAHSLELTVVAEGAETQTQIDFLKKLRCDLVQGYFYSRPLPATDLVQFLHRNAHGATPAASRS